MKQLILLLNILSIPIMGTNINIQGSFFPSQKDQKFFKYYFTKDWDRAGQIELLKNIPIIPYTSISVINLDTNLLHEKQSEFVELKECISQICSLIKWKGDEWQTKFSPWMESKLSNQYKLATLFTAGSHLELNGSNWTRFMHDFKYENAALNKLKKQLKIYLPKRSIKAYEIELSNYDYYFRCVGGISKPSAGSQGKQFSGWVELHFVIPYSQEFFEETKRGLLAALENLKNRPNQETGKKNEATELEEIIMDQYSNRISRFELMIKRPIEIEKTTESSEISSYNITFKELDFNKYNDSGTKPESEFINRLFFEKNPSRRSSCCVSFDTIGVRRKNDIEEVNSLLDEYFEISRPDNTKSRYGKGTLVVLLAFFLCLAITLFSLGYYYRKKVKKIFRSCLQETTGKKKVEVM